MQAADIELLPLQSGDTVWRIRIITGDNATGLRFTTAIELTEPTRRVVEILIRSYKPMMIRGPTGDVIHPKPPGGYPALNSFQRSRR